MRVAIVAGHFMPEMGYQEVYLARAFSRLGHTVRVFTSSTVSPSARNIVKTDYEPGFYEDVCYGYGILRLKPFFSFRSKVMVKGLRRRILSYKPDIVILIAVSKLFGAEVMTTDSKDGMKVISIFGDNKESVTTLGNLNKAKALLHYIGFAVIKRYLYQQAVHQCDRLIMNVPEAERIYATFLRNSEIEAFNRKKVLLRLGFDPDDFFFQDADRSVKRKALGISEKDILLMTSTRVYPRKRLERIIDVVSALHEQGIMVKYVIVGFLDNEYGKALKQYIESQPYPEHFICFPFLSHEEIRRLYCAADLGIWVQVAISIQEAMGTGLSVLLEKKPSTQHLLKEGFNGWYYNDEKPLETVLHEVVQRMENQPPDERRNCRLKRAEANQKFLSYNEIVQEMIAGL